MSSPHSPGAAVWPGGASKQGPHRLAAFDLCPQLEGFSQDLRLRPGIEKDAPTIGTLVHVGLAYRYGFMLQTRPDWLVYPDARTALWTCGQDRPDLAKDALATFDAYTLHYDDLLARGIVPRWYPLLVEHQFEVQFTLPNGATEPYTARIDLLAIENNEIVLIDHKTGSKLSNHSGNSYRTDRQMLTGLALGRANGYDIKHVIINAMTRPMPRAPTPIFGRFPVPISWEAYSRLGRDTAYVLERIQDVRKRWPDPTDRPRNHDACLRKYGRCDFYDVCSEGTHRLAEFVKR